MPHLKCETCRVRVQRAREATGAADACPVCGRPLQAVGHLVDIVGFRSIELAPAASQSHAPGAGYQRLADSVAEIIARRRASERRSRLEAERWLP